MLRLTKILLLAACLVCGIQSARAYALLGPNNEPYQVPDIGYNPIIFIYSDGLGSAPKNLGEEYRRNMPVLFYAYDANFLDFFGTGGVAAIDSAFSVLNSLTNVSSYSSDLGEFPTHTTRQNLTALALSIYDIKSFTMTMMLEQLGLANPERYVWALHNRDHIAGAPPCPQGMEYLIIMRNFDPVTSDLSSFQNSAYVNGILYDYEIEEFCTLTGPNPPPPLADAYEITTDTEARQFTSVAGGLSVTAGTYFTGLTRDDIAGLRYLYRTNNMNTESTGPNTEVFTTNRTPQLLYTSNLTVLATTGLTNDPVTFQALFPGLVVADSSVYFTNVWVASYSTFFTNYPFDPVGAPPHLVYVTNWTLTVQTLYNHIYGNVYTVVQNSAGGYSTVPVTDPRNYNQNASIQVQTAIVQPAPWAPAGSGVLVTNYSSSYFTTNYPVGEYFFLPAGACDIAVLYPQLAISTTTTNVVTITTNIVSSGGGTNTGTTNGFITSLSTVSYVSTALTHAYVIKTIICESNSVALRQGIEHVRFVRRDFDSLLGQFYNPITNFYTLNVVTNNTLVKQRVRRFVRAPDLLFTAQDLVPGPAASPPLFNSFSRNINFNVANIYPGLFGPGTIEPPSRFIFDKNGPLYFNSGPNSTNALGAVYYSLGSTFQPIWGSYDGTTNAPIVFPNGTSIQTLADQVLLQVTNPSLPDAAVGSGYYAQFNVNGGTSPYTWEIVVTPDSGGLPPGLGLDANTGVIFGTPTMPGTFDFVVRVTEGGQRSSDWNFSLNVNP